jgi:hypothetical protein
VWLQGDDDEQSQASTEVKAAPSSSGLPLSLAFLLAILMFLVGRFLSNL